MRWAAVVLIAVVWVSDGVAQNNSNNPHGKIKWDCINCHTTDSWTTLKKQMDFDHDDTRFPLEGVHQTTDCMSCHTLKFADATRACLDCHTDAHSSNLGMYCQNCHTPQSWNDPQNMLQIHAERGFPLSGAHAISDCQSCHTTELFNEFSGTANSCFTCHMDDFNQTENPDHQSAAFSMQCETCHLPAAINWQQSVRYEHPPQFAINGAHRSLDCADCHSETFAGTPDVCFDCHSEEFRSVEMPDHAAMGFPTECAVCHSENGWQGAAFDHVQASGFALNGAHAIAQCVDCHADNQLAGLPRDCFGCHETEFQEALEPNHVANNFPAECQTCHVEVAWQPATFDHDLTDFPLSGAHATIQCADCHENGEFIALQTDCYACHQTDFENAAEPDHVANNFSLECMDCHTTTAWEPATFDHNATDFPLTGAHISVNCIDCHGEGYAGTPTACYSCHQTDFEGTTDPNHVENNFSFECEVCHTTTAWEPATFDHNATDFPLTGAHISVNCIDCHGEGYAGTPTACYSCHQTDFESTTDPNHVENNFSFECETCHNTNVWQPALFDHNATDFPLTGAHVSVNCIDCHGEGYAGTPTACYSCHQTDFESTTDPNHVENNFSFECETCHNTNLWEPALFDHNATDFPLTGAHISVNCIDCHGEGYAGTPTACYSCHQTDFEGTTDPNHVENNFSFECEVCHTTTAWEPATFDHNATDFPLTGAHISVNCIDCHGEGYAGTPTACYSCHQTDFEGTTDPNHVENNFSFECEVCHTTTAWEPATFDHNATDFPLTGAHVSVNCIDCHGEGYAGTPTACYSCHQTDFENTTDPNHVENNFSFECETCHNTNLWEPALFDHNATDFPLTGAHVSVNCIDCHGEGYAGTPTACYSCHQTDFENTTDPNHVENNFSFECETCHNTNLWEPALFDHNATDFPLTGAHVSVNCIDCHGEGYAGTPTACYSCHQTDFEGTTDPNHVENNFSFECEVCHTTTAWEPATFDHNATDFPLTGAHVSVNCIDCHGEGYAGTPTACFACHETDFQNTNNPNHVAAGFPLECEVCHTTTEWQAATYDHDETGYPLTGAHILLTCNDCHAGGYSGTPTVCVGCHLDDYQSTTDPDHAAAGFPTECETCHNTTTWDQTNWNHDQLYFPIYSGEHRNEWDTCADCHVDQNNFAVFECIFCHEHRQSEMDNEHDDVSGYVYESTACYACHPDGRERMRLDRIRQ